MPACHTGGLFGYGHPAILHTGDMSQPTYASVLEEGKHEAIPTLSSTVLLVMWSLQEMPRMRLIRHRMWKATIYVFDGSVGVHDSLL